MSRLFLLLIPVILFACHNDSKKTHKYNSMGKIKREIYYPDKKDTTTFFVKQYYQNGNIQVKTQFLKGKRTGRYEEFYNNGTRKIVESYLNGTLNGIVRKYTTGGNMKEERLYIKGRPVVVKKYFENTKAHLIKMIPYLFDKDSLLHQLGVVIYDTKNNKIRQDLSFFYDINGPDTIVKGDRTKYLITFPNKREDFRMELSLGKLNPDLTLHDTIYHRITSKDSITYTFIPDKSGTHLLTGILYLKNDTVTLTFPVYKEYFVK